MNFHVVVYPRNAGVPKPEMRLRSSTRGCMYRAAAVKNARRSPTGGAGVALPANNARIVVSAGRIAALGTTTGFLPGAQKAVTILRSRYTESSEAACEGGMHSAAPKRSGPIAPKIFFRWRVLNSFCTGHAHVFHSRLVQCVSVQVFC
jgi:hypothetical protein